MTRVLLIASLCLCLSLPSHSFFQEALLKFQESTLSLLINIKDSADLLISEYENRLEKDRKDPRLALMIARELDSKLSDLRDLLDERLKHLKDSPIFTSDFREELANTIEHIDEYIDQKFDKFLETLENIEKLE